MNAPTTSEIYTAPSITFEQYEAFCTSTAVYKPDIAETYLCLGLAGETGELLDILLGYRGDVNHLMLELGDSQWYAARLCTGYRFDFAKMCEAADERRREGNHEPSGSPKESGANMACMAGRIADKVKKRLRDGDNWSAGDLNRFLNEVREFLILFLAHSMELVSVVNARYGTAYSYHRVLTMNRDKLQSRKERGTLHGSGDHR
jgi:hypothetical protein